MTTRSVFSLLHLLLLTVLLPGICSAQVVLKPNGSNAIPLRVKAVTANVIIDGQFAATRVTLTFQNETPLRTEADFIYTLPPDTLVTSFAYWYGEECVQAKIVEKEQAAAIYQHITERMRDPALVEMIGKNTFRARIFPVMPNSDLKVEMTLVQALGSDVKGAHFLLPLRMERGEALDQVDVHVHVNPNADIATVTNSYGLPVGHSGRAYVLALKAKRFRPQSDLRVNLIRRDQPLYADLFATRSESDWGYFALAVTPDRDLDRPQIRVVGVPVTQVLPTRVGSLKAHRAFILLGRYHIGGSATVLLTGQSSHGSMTFIQQVRFSTQRQPDSVVTKLWAAQTMEALSANDRNRETVMQMSLRYKMPCRYTSWLAVPQDEMRRYNQEIAQAKIQTVTNQLGALILAKREGSATAQRLRSELNALCKKTGDRPAEMLRGYYRTSVDGAAQRLMEEILAGREDSVTGRRLRAELNAICRQAGCTSADAITIANKDRFEQLSSDLSHLVIINQGYSATALALKSQLARIAKYIHLSRAEMQYYYPPRDLRGQLESLAAETEEAEHGSSIYRENGNDSNLTVSPAKQPDPARAQRARAELNRLADEVGVSPEDYLHPIEVMWLEHNVGQLRDRLKAERQASHPDTDTIKRLESDLIRLSAEWKRQREAEDRAERLPAPPSSTLWAGESDRRIAPYPGPPPSGPPPSGASPTYARTQANERHVRTGDPLISVDAPIDAAQVVALMPGGEIKRLAYNHTSGKWEARFDIPTYATAGDYTITVIIVLKSGIHTRLQMRYHVDLTPPTGKGTAQVTVTNNAMLRLQLDAGEDAARVKALLPWGELVELTRSGQSHRFFALAPVSPEHRNMASVVRYIITDRAHNRTTILVDMTAQ